MVIEPMPEVLPRDGIPRPVRGFEVLEDDARVFVLLGIVVPHVVIAARTSWARPTSSLKPRVLVGRVIQHQLRNYSNSAAVRFAKESFEVLQGAITWVDLRIVGNVVSIVLEWRRIERK